MAGAGRRLIVAKLDRVTVNQCVLLTRHAYGRHIRKSVMFRWEFRTISKESK